MSRTDDANYENDYRVRGRERAGEKITVTVYDAEEDCDIETELPTRWGVCPTCNGNGTHVDPSIDCNGLTTEDFAEDPDFREEYMAGRYDTTCYECGGRRVVPEIDEERCDPKLLKAYYDYQADLASYRAECAAERRMGA